MDRIGGIPDAGKWNRPEQGDVHRIASEEVMQLAASFPSERLDEFFWAFFDSAPTPRTIETYMAILEAQDSPILALLDRAALNRAIGEQDWNTVRQLFGKEAQPFSASPGSAPASPEDPAILPK